MTPPVPEHLKQVWHIARNAGADYVEVVEVGYTRVGDIQVTQRYVVAILDERDELELGYLARTVANDLYWGTAAGVTLDVVVGPVWQHSELGPAYPLRDQTEDWLMDLYAKCERKLIALESGKKPEQQRDRWALWAKRVDAELARRAAMRAREAAP